MRSLVQRTALALAAVVGLLGTRPATANAQKALVYCPVTVDATGCNAIVTALTGPAYPLGVDRGYDGTNGTVDLKAVDLFSYSVFVVPSLADDSTSQPYALLRGPEVAEHLKAALIGRLAMWSGSPDQGASNRAMKDALIQNLAAWAAGAYATAKGPGLVTLLDASASATTRYDWVRAITPVPVTSDPNLLIYSSVRSLDARATTILTSGTGPIAYTNMATFGFQAPNGAAGVSLDAVGQTGSSQGGQVVLLTMEAGNAGGAVVMTDKDDYAPGETVVISGTGWEGGETVKLTLHMDPLRDSDTELTATADASGNFTNTDFAPGTYDVGVRFVLTALGTTSGRRAQTTFTDGPTDFGVSISPTTAASGGSQSYTLRVWNASDNGNNGLGSANVTVPLGWTVTTPLATPTGSPNARTWTASLASGVIQLRSTANNQRLGRTNGSNAADTIKLVFTATAPSVAVATPYTWSTIAQTSNTLSDPATANWTQTSPNAVVTVSPATVATTTTPSGATATYGDASVNLSATVTPTAGTVNTGTVTFTVKQGATTIGSATTSGTVTGGNASVTYALPAGTAAGPYTIEAVYNAGSGFTGSNGTATLTINTRPITVTADAKAKVYGNIDPALTFQITSGSLAAGDGFTGSLARAAGENVGSYAIQKGTLALNTNYTLTYVGASLTIGTRAVTVAADPQTKVYGDADPALTYQITSGSLAFADAFSGALARAPGNNVGTYAIQQGTLALSSNYSLTYIGANLTITGRPITVTADAKSKVYGDADPSLTYQITSGTLAAGDAFSGALARVAGENVGTYAIQQGTVTAGTNYALTFIGANLTITTRAVTVTADPQTKVYGNADPTLSYQVTSGSLVSGDSFSGSLSRSAGESVGTYAITQGTLSAGTNYALTFVGANLTVTTRAVTVTADPKNKTYGDPDPGLTYQITSGSLAFSDAFSGALARAPGENIGTYAITQGTLALNSNYALTFNGANLPITQRAITVTADPKSKVYGDADPALTYQITSGSLAFSDVVTGALTRASGENVGTYAITQGSVTAGPNYTITFVSANLSITTRAITVTADAQTKVYGNADPAFTYQVTSGSLVSGDSFSGSLSRAGGENIGTFPITQGTLTAGSNYTLSYIGANLTITARPVTVTADAQTKVYGNADPALTYQITSGSLAFTDVFSGSLARVAGENVGTYAVNQGTLALSANYALTFVGANFTITQRPVTVTADAKTKVYGDADPALTYSITSGSLAFSDAFTGALTRAAGENVGAYAIQQGTLALTPNYALTYVGANLTISARPITVTADPQTKVYGNPDPSFTYQVTSGSLVSGDSFSGTLARAPGESVGTYAINQGTLSAGANYALTFVGASLAITTRPVTVTADPQTKVYGNGDPALTYQITSGTLAFSDAFTGALARVAGENVGAYAITQGTLALNSNYALSFVGANLTITVRPITVTADAKTKVYGDADPALTYQITSGSLAFSDAFSGGLTRVAGENVGGYAIQQGTLALSSNYNLSFVAASLSITQRPITVAADAKTKVYGDADPALTYQLTAGTLVNGDGLTGSLTRVAGEAVGTYAIQQGGLTAGANYELTFVPASLNITARPITVTADAKSKVYGNADPALTYQVTSGSLAFSDAFTGALTRVAGENVGAYAIQQGTLALTSNYDLTYVGANLTITARPITVTADAKTKVYGDADPVLTYQITSGSLAFSDAFSGALTRATGNDVGTYPIQQGTLALSSNYALTYVGANLTITPRPITVTADDKSKVYGNADPVLTYQVTSGSLVDEGDVSGALARVAGENIGSYAITQGTLAATTNYALTFVPGTLTITKRPIEITADPKSKVYGNGDPALTYQITAGSLAFSDAFTGTLTRVSGESVGSYAILQGGVTAGGNYALTYLGADLTVTQRPIAVTADAKSKVYGDADPSLTYQITSGSLAFSDGFSGALTRVAGEAVGTYAINQGTLALSANYSLTYNGALLTITKRAVTITADAKSKTYGYADPALTYQVTSGSLAFSDAFTGALARAAGENVGTYAINQGTVALTANYALTFVPGVFNITQRAITITADAKTKTYGYADPALTYQLTSGTLVSGDAFTGALTRVVGENVGAYAIQQGTVTAGANYNLAYVGANLSIGKRPLAVTAADASKIAGAANPLLTGSIVGAVAADNITASYGTTATTLSPPNTYPIVPSIDANLAIGNYTVALNNGTLTVAANAKPVLGVFSGPLLPVALGASINLSIPFTDVDVAASQPYTATIDWGNGTTTTSSYALPGTISGNKTYPAVGVYTVTVTVQQDNYPSTHYDTKTFEYYVVVYDPNGGFVTGGGWIDSPAGACKRAPCTPLTVGKANFGFVSKYKKGQSAPDGNTEFQFKAGDINFHSEVYEWLVVAGAKAQFKGTGTINGSGNYGFMLTAIDGQINGGGGVDKFRIKIWDKNNGDAVVYDNQVIGDPSDTAIPTTVLGGGSINIQAK